MQVYEEILDQVHAQGSNNHLLGCAAWDAFWLFYEELVVNRCDDGDQASIDGHADKLQNLAEIFVDKFIDAATAEAVTPYMHTMLADIPRLVREHGSLVKFSSQGVERLHQWVKFITQHRSNKQAKDVAGSVLGGMTRKASRQAHERKHDQVAGRKRQAANAVVKPGGNMSKAARQFKDEKTAERHGRLDEAAQAGPDAGP